jgi:hypothetical protein
VVFSTNKTDRHDVTEILLKVALNTINQPGDDKQLFLLTVKANRTGFEQTSKINQSFN